MTSEPKDANARNIAVLDLTVPQLTIYFLKLAINRTFRTEMSKDPKAALASIGIPVPPGFKIKSVELPSQEQAMVNLIALGTEDDDDVMRTMFDGTNRRPKCKTVVLEKD